jgi:hypothetical protein
VAHSSCDEDFAFCGVAMQVAFGLAHRFAEFDVARHMHDRPRPVSGEDFL